MLHLTRCSIVTGHVSTQLHVEIFQEELARKRELPVPPEPRRGGILARSDDNLAGEIFN